MVQFIKNKRALAAALSIIVVTGLAVVAFVVLPARNDAKTATDGLVIYSPHPVEMTDYIVREFRQRTGIKVQVITGGTGALIAKLRDPTNSQKADLFWGGGIESLETVKDQFQAYTSSEQNAIAGTYASADRLWSPFSVLPVVIIYNTKLVTGKLIPGSWASLLDPYFRDHLIMADPATSGSGFTILVTMLRTMAEPGTGGGEGWPFVRRLIAQFGSSGIVPGSTTVYNSVSEGEFFAGITFENSALSLKKAGKDIDFRYPAEGTSAVPDGIALLKGAPHAAEAKRFIDFALGRDVQSLLMTKWFRRSVRNDVPSYKPGLDELRVIDYPIADSAARRTQILSRWAQEHSPSRP
jgi:iron(III) transport system substrate-binding protein